MGPADGPFRPTRAGRLHQPPLGASSVPEVTGTDLDTVACRAGSPATWRDVADGAVRRRDRDGLTTARHRAPPVVIVGDEPTAHGGRCLVSLDVPHAFVASYATQGPSARRWLRGLPGLAAEMLDRWALRPDGPTAHGMASVVLPVIRVDGTRAALKLQEPREETTAAVIGLRAWHGDGIVHLLADDPGAGALLLERLDADRALSTLADDGEAMEILAGLLARLVAVPAPADVRRLADVAAAMLDEAPRATRALRDPAEQRLLRTSADVVAELVSEPGDRLLHWDLHHDNVLAGEREPWLAIDPEPLAGDPGFDLLPALDSRWDAVVASGDVTRAILRRFDLLTEAAGADRQRAVGWTLGRVLQNALWDVEDGKNALEPAQVTIADVLLRFRASPRLRSAVHEHAGTTPAREVPISPVLPC